MCRTYRRHLMVLLIWCITVLAGISFIACQQTPPGPTSNKQERQLEQLTEETISFVEPGNETNAFSYYKETFDELALNPKNLSGEELVKSQNLKLMLEFLGYETLTPGEAEDLPSAELMKRFPDNILSSAFFAPKITDVSVKPEEISVGWRKVLRLKALAGFEAEKRGIAAGFILFNKFQGTDRNKNPFAPRDDKSNESDNTQLILVRANPSPLKRPLYFFMYEKISTGGGLKTFLKASFDARDPKLPAVPPGKYFVPQSCAECHGGLRGGEPDHDRLKLNYLDSDHWFDRLNDDFSFLKDVPFGVLFDGGKDETKEEFEKAFNVLRLLNNEIKDQNVKVEPTPTPDPPSFQLRAASKWLQLHETNSHHQDLFARVLPPDGDAQWRADRMPDRELLPLLNQYCFRCHSSLRFNIFDRPAVVRRKFLIGGKDDPPPITSFLDLPLNNKRHMPQDRILTDDVKERIKALARSL